MNMDRYPEPMQLVAVAQAIVDGSTPVLFDDQGQELGPVERIRFLDYPQAEYLVAGKWQQASAFDLVDVLI